MSSKDFDAAKIESLTASQQLILNELIHMFAANSAVLCEISERLRDGDLTIRPDEVGLLSAFLTYYAGHASGASERLLLKH